MGSGGGSNAAALVDACGDPSCPYTVVGLATNRATSGLVALGERSGIGVHLTDGSADDLLAYLDRADPVVLVLAGYMRILPTAVIERMHGRVLNIHPSLLPSYGGHGMFGLRVHQAVLDAGERETGATVHLVTEVVDGGAILGQAWCPVDPGMTPQDLQERVKILEHSLYPSTVAVYCRWLVSGTTEALPKVQYRTTNGQ